MITKMESTPDEEGIPASLRRKAKEPMKTVHFSIPVAWWNQLSGLASEFDQNVSTFLREATEDWLRRATKVRTKDAGAIPIVKSVIGEGDEA